jgi:4-hydroxy-L-threonine phosphate dehydrogenase PdxA
VGKPIIAIMMGDPSGIGPETAVKVLAQNTTHDLCRPLVVGHPKVMSDIWAIVADKVHPGVDLHFRAVGDVTQARFSFPVIDVLCPEGVEIVDVKWGKMDPAMGRVAGLCLAKAFRLAMDGLVQGVVAAPLHKEAFHRAGYNYPDELAFLADLSASPDPVIMGVAGAVWTVAVAEHVAFRDILALVKKDRILRYISKMHDTLKQTGLAAPRIAVAALNVHAGEGGLLGREEIDEIGPAVQAAQTVGVNIEGPVPADMVFVRAFRGDFDGVVCMHHDQANIARKLQPMNQGATIFAGLPVAYGTTAHGTAFDIAGQGIADPGSLQAALKYVIRLSARAPAKL